MGFFKNFPYTNFHSINLDWIVEGLKSVEESVEHAVYSSELALKQISEFSQTYDPEYIFSGDVLIIGDSYTAGTAGMGGEKWYEYVMPVMGVSSAKYHVYAHGGYGFTPAGSTYSRLIAAAVNGDASLGLTAMSATQRANTRLVMIVGGTNDRTATETEISLGMVDFNRILTANFPNAVVHVFNAGWSTSPTVRPADKRTYWAYHKANTLNTFGWTIHDVYPALHSSALILGGTDNIHPTPLGVRHIAYGIINAFRGGVINNQRAEINDGTLVGGSSDACPLVVADVNGAMVNGVFWNANINYSDNKPVLSTTKTAIFTAPAKAPFITSAVGFNAPFAYQDESDNTRHYAFGHWSWTTDNDAGVTTFYLQLLDYNVQIPRSVAIKQLIIPMTPFCLPLEYM